VEGIFAPSYTRIQVITHGLSRRPRNVKVDDASISAALYDQETRTLTFEAGLFHTVEVAF
jgi:hypothetical protein